MVVFILVCVYAHQYLQTYTCMQTYIHTYLCTCTRAHTHRHSYTNTYIHTHTGGGRARVALNPVQSVGAGHGREGQGRARLRDPGLGARVGLQACLQMSVETNRHRSEPPSAGIEIGVCALTAVTKGSQDILPQFPDVFVCVCVCPTVQAERLHCAMTCATWISFCSALFHSCTHPRILKDLNTPLQYRPRGKPGLCLNKLYTSSKSSRIHHAAPFAVSF